jgi:hypothetical protein
MESACPDFSLVLACYQFSNEVIFLDDASGDRTRHWCRLERLREVQNERRPPDRAQPRSLVKTSDELEPSLAEVAVPERAADEVVRVEVSSINPSDPMR